MGSWQDLLISSYKNVDDLDGIYGVFRNINSPEQQTLLLEHEKEFSKALQMYDVRLSANPKSSK